MMSDFKTILARIQQEYDFYIRLQQDTEGVLAGYKLSAQERGALENPDKLAGVLWGSDAGITFQITISGTHDWFNPTNVQPAHVDSLHFSRSAIICLE